MIQGLGVSQQASLPLWECGLKLLKKYPEVQRKKSLPLWECGLKFPPWVLFSLYFWVAPFVGVWIEIIIEQMYAIVFCVAPFVGVWIEIYKTEKQE